MSNLSVNFRHWGTAVAIAAGLLTYYFILIDPPTVLERTIFYAFQSRDIGRALRLLSGWPIFFGPEMTGGGNLPGPFYYILLLPGLWTTGDWRGAWYLMMGLAGASAVLAWFFFRRRQMPMAGLLFVTLLPLCVITQHYMTLFINPSYLFIAVVAALILICDAFSPSQPAPRRNRSFVVAALVISIGIQIHYSIIFLFFAALFMQWRAERMGLPKIGRKHFLWGLFAFALPFTPYLAWSLAGWMGQPFGQPSVYVGEVSDVWPTMLHLLNAVYEFDPAATFRRMLIQLINNTPWALVLVSLTLGVSRKAALRFPEAAAIENPKVFTSGRELIKPLAICAAFGFIPFSYVFFVPIANRYSLPMVMSLLVLSAVAIETLLNSRLKIWVYNALAAGIVVPAGLYLWFDHGSPADPVQLLLGAFLALMAVVLTFIRQKELPTAKVAAVTLTALLAGLHLQLYRSGGLRSNENNMVRYTQWRTVWREVYRRTGWSVEDLKGRVYFVNAHTNGDPEPTYRSIIRETGPVRAPTASPPDGYILIVNPPHAAPDLRDWLLTQPIAEDLKEGLRNGEVELSDPISGPMMAVAYTVKQESRLPKRFHNWGLYYNSSEHAEFLNAYDNNKAYKLANNQFVFLWNECPDAHPYCNSAAQVEVERTTPSRVNVRVNVIGEALSQNSPWIHPTWTQSWNDPYVELECGGHKQTLKLASSIGYRREYLVYEPVTLYFIGNNSILAPFERSFSVDCPAPMSEISVGRASSSVDQVRGTLTLPAQRLSLKL